MKKLTLNLDDLLVESFDSLSGAAVPGRTVGGFEAGKTDEECGIETGHKKTCDSCLNSCPTCETVNCGGDTCIYRTC